MKTAVPFFANTNDNTHCYQAIVKSVLKYYFPDKDYSWKALDTFTGKKPGMATWPTQSLLHFQSLGLNVNIKEMFDYQEFGLKGKEYLLRMYG